MALGKYGAAFTIEIPIVKRAAVDFAVSADWTPSAGDVKVSKDGGAAANIGTLPTAITMGNTAIWQFVLTGTEMTAARVVITVADSATKAVEDQAIIIDTYGNASATHPFDLGTALASQTVGTATAVTTVNGLAANVLTATAINSGAITSAKFAASAIDATAIATGAITAAKFAASAIDATAIATGAITNAKFAAGAIDAAAVATDAIGAAELAADAVTEIAAAISIPSAATNAAAVWDKLLSSHTAVGSFGQRLQSARTGTAQAGAGSTITLDASASATNSLYNGQWCFLTGGTGAGQSRLVSGYVGATKVATVSTAWATNPDNTSVFVLLPTAGVITAESVVGAVGSVTGAVGSVTGAVGSVTGAVGSVTGNVGGNVVGTVASVVGAVGSVTGNVGGNVVGTVASVVGAVGSVAAGGIVAASFAADAITASKLHADVTTELQAGLATAAALITAQADLDDIQTRLPAALIGGRIDANVGAISSDATAADNAEAFFDGTGYAGTNNVIPTVTTVTGGATSAAVAALNNISTAQVKTQVTDALAVDTYAEPTAAPAATASLKNKIGWLAAQARNKAEQTTTTTTLYADDGTTPVATSTVSDAAGTFTRGEWA